VNKNKKQSVGRPPDSSAIHARDLILKTYFEISNREGMESVTLQKIANNSGLALNTIRYHFNRQGLSLSKVALDYVSDKTYEFLDAGMLKARSQKNFDPVHAYLNLTFDWMSQQPIQASFLVYYYYLSSTQVELAIDNKELIEIAQQRISGLIYEGIGMKLYKINGSVDQLKRQIHMVLLGACMVVITSRNESLATTYKKECLELCRSILGVN
jgi:hypothetical protein